MQMNAVEEHVVEVKGHLGVTLLLLMKLFRV